MINLLKRVGWVLSFIIIGYLPVMAQQTKPAPTKKTSSAPATTKKAATPTAPSTHPPEPDYIKSGGIAFQKDSIDKVFEKAKAANKAVFVEIYSPDCHVCQSFMPTLAGKKVGDLYNQYFISTKLDLMQKPTQEWLEKKKLYIPSLPLFLYFDADGNLLHVTMTNNDADEINGRAGAALNPQYRSQQFPQRYANGERDANFLIEYGLVTKIIRDTTANIRVMEDYAKQQPTTEYANGTNWLVLQKIIMDFENPIAQYLINNQAAYKQYGVAEARGIAEGLLMGGLYSPRAAQFTPEKIQQINSQLIKIGIDQKLAAARTLLPELNAYFRLKQTTQAAARMNKHMADFTFSVPEYVFVARYFNERSTDTSDVPSLVKWIDKALATPKIAPAEKADLYYELAEVYRRANRSDEALKAARTSLEVAQLGKLDTKRYAEKVDKLK